MNPCPRLMPRIPIHVRRSTRKPQERLRRPRIKVRPLLADLTQYRQEAGRERRTQVKPRCRRIISMSASLIGHWVSSTFRLSTVAVSMSLAGSRFSSESALKALPSWGSKTRRNNLLVGLDAHWAAGPSGHTNSPHPSSREGHRSTAWWNLNVLLLCLIQRSAHAAAPSRVHWNSVPSIHMRCMTTASLRARATIAFFIPRVLAIFIAQALSQDHLVERTSTIWAAS